MVRWQNPDSVPGGRLLEFLDAFAAIPEVAAAKRRSFELLGAAPGRRLLDAGCGTGTDALALAELVAPGGSVVGVDLSETALAAARERAGGRPGLQFEHADLTKLPFPDGSFDGVRADRALHHAEDPEVAVAELVRVTRPGGTVVVSEAPATLSDGRRPPGTASYKRLWPFLPVLFREAGVDHVELEHGDVDLEPSPLILDVLGAGDGPLRVRFLHLRAVVPAHD